MALPPEEQLISKAKIKELLSKLLKLNNTPPEIALGVSIGVFVAIMPLYGFHTLLCIVFAFLIRRANKIAILVGTNISLPPTLPLITWAGYSLGRFILGEKYPPLRLSSFKGITFQKMLDFYYPLLVGSFALGVSLAVMFYFLTLWFIEKRRKAQGILQSRVREKDCLE